MSADEKDIDLENEEKGSNDDGDKASTSKLTVFLQILNQKLSHLFSKIDTNHLLPFGIARTPLLIGITVSLLIFGGLLIFAATQSSKVITEHNDNLGFAFVYIEEAVREGKLVTVQSGSDDGASDLEQEKSKKREIDQNQLNALYVETPFGQVPKISADGDTVFKAFRQDTVFPEDASIDNPSISLIMLDSGLRFDPLTIAQEKLPNSITFAFSPYAKNLGNKVQNAFENGFESWLLFPSETAQFPLIDPGPLVFLRNVNPRQNSDRLEKLSTSTKYITGLIGVQNSIALESEQEQATFAQFMRASGMGYIHHRADSDLEAAMNAGSIRYAHGNLVIDLKPLPENIRLRLNRLVEMAKSEGSAIGYFHPYQSSIDEIEKWTKTLGELNVRLVPASKITK